MITQLVVALLGCIFLVVPVIDGFVIRKEGYCVAYSGGSLPVKYNGLAKNVSEVQFNLLKEVCPYLTINGQENTRTCCDIDQIKTLKRQFSSTQSLFSNCQVSVRNLKDFWCEFTCSPNQSMFVDYQQNVPRATTSYYVTTGFANGLFKSCRDVMFPGGEGRVLDYACRTSADAPLKCTPETFLSFLGNPQGGAPFSIKIKINETVENITANDHDMHRCNESFVEQGSGRTVWDCICEDCRSSTCYPTTPSQRSNKELVITIKSTVELSVDVYQKYQSRNYNFSGAVHKRVLEQILLLQQRINSVSASMSGKSITLQDICYKPNLTPSNTECKVASPLQYFQMSKVSLDKCITNFGDNCSDPSKMGLDAEDWHDQILGCTRDPFSTSNGFLLKSSCLSTYGQGVEPNFIFSDLGNTINRYASAKSLIIRIYINETTSKTDPKKVKAWRGALEAELLQWKINEGRKEKLSAVLTEYDPMGPTNSPVTTKAATTSNSPVTTKAATTPSSDVVKNICNMLLLVLTLTAITFQM